jgi:hypothetical protein
MEFFTTLASKFQGTESRFVFIIPPGETIVCSASGSTKLKEFWDKVTVFSAEFDPKKRIYYW